MGDIVKRIFSKTKTNIMSNTKTNPKESMDRYNELTRIQKFTKLAKEVLLNKTIIDVRYLTDSEMDEIGWYSRPLCFFLNDGTYCVVSCDDEGNDGGTLFYNSNGVLPTL